MIIRTNYTDKDNAFIRDNYQNLSDKQMAGILKRTKRGIEVQRRKLGLLHMEYQSIKQLNQAQKAYKEMRGLEELLKDGRLNSITERRLNELRANRNFNIKGGNTPKMPREDQALCYELHCMGISLLQKSKKLGYTWAMVDRVIKRISPYSGPNPVTITITSNL